MAIYKRLLVTGAKGVTANDVTDTASTNFYGYKSITLEESFANTEAAATRISFVKANPTTVIKYDDDFSGTPGTTPIGAKVESWNITEKTRAYQIDVDVDEDGNETSDPDEVVGTKKKTVTSTHVILKYTIKLQDFWIIE